MKNLKSIRNVSRTAMLGAVLAVSSVSAYAQGTNLGKEVVDNAKDGLVNILSSVVSLLQVIMGLGALVCLTIVIFKVFKGDREAAEKLAWWVGGLTVGFLLITVVSNLVSGM